MLPVPLLEERPVGPGGSQRRRGGALRAVTRLANAALSTVNALLGFPLSSVGEPSCGVHAVLRAEVLERSKFFQPEHPIAGDGIIQCTGEAALSELLKGRSVYEANASGCAVKPFGSGPVSLPNNR